MKAYGGNGCIDPHFFYLGTSWRWVVNLTPRPLYPRGRSPRYFVIFFRIKMSHLIVHLFQKYNFQNVATKIIFYALNYPGFSPQKQQGSILFSLHPGRPWTHHCPPVYLRIVRYLHTLIAHARRDTLPLSQGRKHYRWGINTKLAEVLESK
jgi:hypothetical protein